MLDRSIPTRKALVHSISNGEVKDMKNDVLWVLKASFSQKTLNLVCRLNFNNFQVRKNCIDFEFLLATIPLLELTFLKSI